MNILFIKHFLVGFMVSEIPRVFVFGYFPLSITMICIIYNIHYNLYRAYLYYIESIYYILSRLYNIYI